MSDKKPTGTPAPTNAGQAVAASGTSTGSAIPEAKAGGAIAPRPATTTAMVEQKSAPPAPQQAVTAQGPQTKVINGGPRKTARLRGPGRWIPLWIFTIIAPIAVTTWYLGWAAAPRFVTEARFVVQSVEGPAPVPQGALAVLSGVTGPARQDQQMVSDFMLSADMVKLLEERLPLRRMTVAEMPDLLWWLPENSPVEWMVRRLRSVVNLTFDEASGITTMRVQALGAADAQMLASTLLSEATRFVNRVSTELARDSLNFAEAEASRALSKVQQARVALSETQAATQVLDPTAEGGLTTQQLAQIERQIGETDSEIAALLTFIREDNPRIVAARARANDLRRQADTLRRQIGPENTRGAADLLLRFRSLQADLEFAEANYRASLAALETARARAAREQKRLVLIVEPRQPEWAALPATTSSMLAVILGALAFHLVLAVTIGIVREHRSARR